jgi:hypothetical protein
MILQHFIPILIHMYDLLNDAASNSDHISSNDRMINETMNWKGCGRKLSWPDFRYNPSICLEGRRNASVRLVGIAAEIETEHIPNM